MNTRSTRGSRTLDPRPVRAVGDGDRRWRRRLRLRPGWQRCYRSVVFFAGLLLVLAAAALWLFSVLLMLPLVLAGLWLWATEFGWGRRLFEAVRDRARRLRRRATAHPTRWALLTSGGLAAGGATAWALGRFQLLDRAMTAVGL